MSEEAAYYKCTKSVSRLFTAGVCYEVHHYDGVHPWIATDKEDLARLPFARAEFEPYDPWAYMRDHQPLTTQEG